MIRQDRYGLIAFLIAVFVIMVIVGIWGVSAASAKRAAGQVTFDESGTWGLYEAPPYRTGTMTLFCNGSWILDLSDREIQQELTKFGNGTDEVYQVFVVRYEDIIAHGVRECMGGLSPIPRK